MSKITGIVENITYNKEIVPMLNKEYPTPIVDIDLPDKVKGTDWKYFGLPNNDVLIFSNGIWLLDFEIKTFTKIYDSTYAYRMLLIKNALLISGGDGADGILRYDLTTKTITKIPVGTSTKGAYSMTPINDTTVVMSTPWNVGLIAYDDTKQSCYVFPNTTGTWTYIPVGDKCLCFSGGKGIQVYNTVDGTLTKIYDSEVWKYGTVINNEKVLLSTQSAYTEGVLLYNSTDDTLTKIYEEGAYFQNIIKVTDDKYLFSSHTLHTNSLGVFLFNNNTNTFTRLFTEGYDWGRSTSYKKISNKILLWGTVDNSGLIVYNVDNDTIMRLGESTYSSSYILEFNNKCLISSSRTENPGLYVYNSVDDSFIQLLDTAHYYDKLTIMESDNNKAIISSYNGKVTKIYDYSTDTVTDLLDIYTYNAYYINDRYYITGSGIRVYNHNTGEIAIIKTIGSDYTFHKRTDGKYFVYIKRTNNPYPSFINPVTHTIDSSINTSGLEQATRYGEYITTINNKDVLIATTIYDINNNTTLQRLGLSKSPSTSPGNSGYSFPQLYNDYIINDNYMSDIVTNDIIVFKTKYNYAMPLQEGVWMLYGYDSYKWQNSSIAILDLRRGVK